ncbi:MAG TPA: hypothetical protein VFU00_09085, partial [Gemmatimonadales bacterium]|nr:hypothetical protein [Gemmatimonadales bacterium]
MWGISAPGEGRGKSPARSLRRRGPGGKRRSTDTRLIADGTYYVIESGAGLAAAGGWSRRRTLYGGDRTRGRNDAPLDPAREPARIRAFFVHPAYARRGCGRRLLVEASE